VVLVTIAVAFKVSRVAVRNSVGAWWSFLGEQGASRDVLDAAAVAKNAGGRLIPLRCKPVFINLTAVGFEKHLLVDGSNILHAWPELRSVLKHDRDAARSRLSQALSVLHDEEQTRLTVVFDGRGDDLTVEYPGKLKTFAHLYTPAGTTADDVIEQLVGKAGVPANYLVATDDRAERQTIEALGASGISAAELAAWVERASQRQQTRLTGRKRDNERAWRRPEG
jgi:predicted RNA-binding protein with PIN domain